MSDLTNNKTPYGLLTPEEQEHLRGWPHGVEYYTARGKWLNCDNPSWILADTYRTKPAPVKRVEWTSDYSEGCGGVWYDSRMLACIAGCNHNAGRNRIAVIRREWIEGQAPQYFTEEV